MWDRLLVDCNIATFEERPGNPLGLIENGAIGIADGKIVRVGKRTELAGFRAKRSTRSAARGSRRASSTATRISSSAARAPTNMRCAARVLATRRSPKPAGASRRPSSAPRRHRTRSLLEQSRRRLHALMRGGCTTVEVKSGYGLDAASELRLLKIAHAAWRGRSRADRADAARLACTSRRPARPPRALCRRDRRQADPGSGEAGARDQRRRILRDDRLHARRSRAPVQGGRASRPCVFVFTPSNCRTSMVLRWPHNIARCRPIISSISTKPAPRPWPRPAPSQCFCRALIMRCRKSGSRRSHCCASTRCRSRSRPTATRAPRLCFRRRWR